jgi:hypothetical protein
MKLFRIKRDEKGAAVIEMAFGLPVLIVMLYMLVQLGQVFRAMSGIQHALGEGARLATLFPTPQTSVIENKINDSVYGIGPGTFQIEAPVSGVDAATGSDYIDLEVTYTQPTTLLLFPGPTISVARSKRVWIAGD